MTGWALALPWLALAGLYARGWHRLRPRGRGRLADGRRAALALLSALAYAWALPGPMSWPGAARFPLHVLQHGVLAFLAPALLWMARPFAIALWGVPPAVRRAWAARLGPTSPARSLARHPLAAGVVFLSLYLLPLDPGLYAWLGQHPAAQQAWHHGLAWSAVLFWWHALHAAPRWKPRPGTLQRVIVPLAALPVHTGVGVTLTFAQSPAYPGVSVAAQVTAGYALWVLGGLTLTWAALRPLARLIGLEARKPALALPRGLPEADG